MYNGFYGLDRAPFRVNPDPSFLYFSESHEEALATLIYAVKERKGFAVLTGEVGTGKTTVLNALLERMAAPDFGPKVQTAYLFNTVLSLEDFFGYFFEELGLELPIPFRKGRALHVLNDYLIERLRTGGQTLLLIDEAQNLSRELLEEIRMLSNLETPESKLVQIVLVAQPELDQTLALPELRQLRQRVELRHSIRPLDPTETSEYVRQRLLSAGHESGDLFSRGALRALHRLSDGIPRVINVLCDGAMLAGFVSQLHRIPTSVIERAAADLRLGDTPAAEHRRGWLRSRWSKRLGFRAAG